MGTDAVLGDLGSLHGLMLAVTIAVAVVASVPTAASEITGDHAERFEIAVTDKGFEPRVVEVKAGQPVELVFVRKTARTCTRDLILDTGGVKLRIPLLLTEPAAIKTRFASDASFRYVCGKNTFVGKVAIR